MSFSRQSSSRRYTIIVGCGRLGSYLACSLSSKGDSVVIIDRNPDAFRLLSDDFSGFNVEADAAEFDVLEQANTSDADLLIAVSSQDNLNLFVAQTAHFHYKVKTVIARVFDKELEFLYHGTGIQTVCPSSVTSEHFLSLL